MFDISDIPASITDHVEPPARDDGGVILHVGPLGGDESTELAVAHALVRRAGDGEVDEVLRIYTPARPAVVFGRRDTRLPGYAAAVDAPVRAVWPWLMQIGEGRAGFYSYALLERAVGARIHNADRIHPEWQDLHVGEAADRHTAGAELPLRLGIVGVVPVERRHVVRDR